MLWVTKSMFFSNLKTFFAKRTFINVHFSFSQNTFEKNDSLHSLRRPPYQSLRPYLYALDGGARMRDDETIMLTIGWSRQFCERWGRNWGISFFIIWEWLFWGMFAILCPIELLFILFFNRYIFQYINNTENRDIFQKMSYNEKSDLCPKNGGACFRLFRISYTPLFGGSFEYHKIGRHLAALSFFK